MSARGELHDTLHETGHRLTGQRQLLLEVLQEHGGHLDARELYRLAHERDPQLNLSTVYRTLRLLRDLGFVDERHLGEEHHHYELKTGTHYHLICSTCGAVVEFTSPLIEALKTAIGREHDYTIAEMEVDVLGTCPACRAAAAQSSARVEQRMSPRDRVMGILRRSPRQEDGEDHASLRGLTTGRSGRVAALRGGHALVARLAALGLTPGTAFEVSQNPGHGPIIVLVRDTRLVLGRGEAAHVLVDSAETADVQ